MNAASNQKWNAQQYSEHARFVSDLGMPVVELLAPLRGEHILDLGCGDGVLTTKLVDLGCSVVGVDASGEMIAAAKELGLDARVMDGHALQFNGEFDAVFSNAALHWLKPIMRWHVAAALCLCRQLTFGLLLLTAAVLSGCSANHMAVYPASWPQEKAVTPATCPEIAGRYLNAGTEGPDWGSNMQYFCSGYPRGWKRSPNWICNTGLSESLVDDPGFRSVRTIEIRQPDSTTLLISVPDDPSVQPRTLSRGHGDFECGASGLTMSRSGSDYDAVNTILSVLVLHFGVASSSRTFRPLSDGSLLMEVTNQHFVTQEILATGTVKGQGFVRWERDRGE